MVSIVEKQTEIDCDLLTNIILEKEPQIINEYPPIGFYGNETDGDNLPNTTYSYSYDSDTGTFEDSSGDNGGGTPGYGYKYDFKNALSEDKAIVRPPHTSTPAVFELKNPNQNIQGRVR